MSEAVATGKAKWAPGMLLAASLLCTPGCTVGPDFVRPEAPHLEQYTRAGEPAATVAADGLVQRFETGAKVPADWWQLFKSPKLDPVVREALASNRSVQAALASLRQSQDNLRAGYGVFYPQINASFGGARQKSPPLPSQTLAGGIFNLFTLTAAVGYVLDVFGGERRAVESLQAQVDYQRSTVLATYLALTGNIVNAVIARAAYQAEIQATEELIGLLKEQVRTTEAQVSAGTVPHLSLLSLRSQLAAFEATLPALNQKLSQTEHLLAVLSGRAPAEWDPPEIGLADLALPASLPRTVPSELVRQRPDILAAEAQLHASSADIGVATAALFPNFALSGSYGANKTSVGNFFTGNKEFWAVGADITAPLYHGGSLLARQEAAIAVHQRSLAEYRQTILLAFSQVADTLRALEHDAETVQAQSQALHAAEEARNLVQANYEAGIATYLQLLTANGQYHQAKIGYLQGVAQRLQDTVALFVALGGGWWSAENNVVDGLVPALSKEPSPAAVTENGTGANP